MVKNGLRAASADLLDDNAFLRSALDASSDGLLIADHGGRVLYVNEAYERTTGLSREKILGHNLAALLAENYFNYSASLEVLRTKRQVVLIHRYSSGKSALTTATPIYKNDRIVGVLNNTRNITTLLRLREALSGRVAKERQIHQEVDVLRAEQLRTDGVVAVSAPMRQVLALAETASGFDSTVCIHGETGSGKEVIAKFIHKNGTRSGQPFIKVNCAAIPGELFESELFGYEPGAFTGASGRGKIGLFELANGGTILLDEIGELPGSMQSKLLRVLQEGELYRVGGAKPVKLDVRVISATNRDLEAEAKDGKFRSDLFFRLNVLPIVIPPLRERREDIRPLVDAFLQSLNRKYKKTVAIEEAALDMLLQYRYPGNVRELQNLMEYLFVTALDGWIVVASLPPKIISDSFSEMMAAGDGGSDLHQLVEAYEKTIIETVLAQHDSLTRAAAALGVHASTLGRKIKRYGLVAADKPAP